MASNDVEVLDPAAPVEKSTTSGFELDRRHFIALGVAGAAAGTALISASKAEAQQPIPNGYAQVDVLNLMLQVKYLKATLYSYITQGTDLPPASQVTNGAGTVYNAPTKITFTGGGLVTAQQITDVFNEMYYDELNQLIALRALQGVAAANRQTVNLIGTGGSGAAPSSTSTTMTQSQAIGLARLLEDLSASAFANATVYLSGANLALATKALATDAAHAGAIRLIAIQTGAQFQGTAYEATATSNTAQTPVTFSALTTAASNTVYALLGATTLALPAVGNALTGNGIPEGTVITAVNGSVNSTFIGVLTSAKNTITGVSSTAGLQVGQLVTGTNIPANTTISAVGTTAPYVVTMSANASAASATISVTGYVTTGSNQVTSLSTVTGLLVGQQISGTGVPAGATITAINSNAPFSLTMSANATANSTTSVTGNVVSGSAVIVNVSSVTGLIVGNGISGTGIPAGATIVATSAGPNTITLSVPATVSSTGATLLIIATETVVATGIVVTAGTTAITFSQNAGITGVQTISIIVPDNQDVAPADIGSGAANGPAAIAGSSPAVYQGFFNTAGSATGNASTPAGFAFARSFQQVLAVLYGYNSSNSIISTQNYEGGFYPFGVSGTITSAI